MARNILVITATLGLRSTLEKTVESVQKNGCGKVDHIIITKEEYVEQIASKFPNVIVIQEPKYCNGIYPALNYAFRKYGRDYKYLTFINDDDYWLPDFANLINVIEVDNTLDFVYGRIRFIDENNRIIKQQASSNQFYSFLSLFCSNIILFTQQSTLLRSEFFFQIGGFSEDFKLVSDSKLWIDLSLLKPRFKYISTVCAAYMIQESQLSSNKILQIQEHIKLLEMYPKINFWRRAYDKIIFRLTNAKLYLQRL